MSLFVRLIFASILLVSYQSSCLASQQCSSKLGTSFLSEEACEDATSNNRFLELASYISPRDKHMSLCTKVRGLAVFTDGFMRSGEAESKVVKRLQGLSYVEPLVNEIIARVYSYETRIYEVNSGQLAHQIYKHCLAKKFPQQSASKSVTRKTDEVLAIGRRLTGLSLANGQIVLAQHSLIKNCHTIVASYQQQIAKVFVRAVSTELDLALLGLDLPNTKPTTGQTIQALNYNASEGTLMQLITANSLDQYQFRLTQGRVLNANIDDDKIVSYYVAGARNLHHGGPAITKQGMVMGLGLKKSLIRKNTNNTATIVEVLSAYSIKSFLVSVGLFSEPFNFQHEVRDVLDVAQQVALPIRCTY